LGSISIVEVAAPHMNSSKEPKKIEGEAREKKGIKRKRFKRKAGKRGCDHWGGSRHVDFSR